MINYTDISIKNFEDSVDLIYPKNRSNQGDTTDIIKNMGRISLSRFAQSDSLYFSIYHVLDSAKIGLEILNAISHRFGALRDGMAINLMASILFCNIGIIKGLLNDDQFGNYKVSNTDFIKLEVDGTDSAIWKHKIYRSWKFVEDTPFLNTNTNSEILLSAIEHSEFIDSTNKSDGRSGVVEKYNRAAQIISLMSSTNYHRTMTELFYSASEGCVIDKDVFGNLGMFKEKWPQHFWDTLYPDVAETILILRETDRGRNIVSAIYAHVDSF